MLFFSLIDHFLIRVGTVGIRKHCAPPLYNMVPVKRVLDTTRHKIWEYYNTVLINHDFKKSSMYFGGYFLNSLETQNLCVLCAKRNEMEMKRRCKWRPLGTIYLISHFKTFLTSDGVRVELPAKRIQWSRMIDYSYYHCITMRLDSESISMSICLSVYPSCIRVLNR